MAGTSVGGVIPRKRFGQHFLTDRAAIEAIVAAIAPRPDDRLVEIGPGTAALTAPLMLQVGSMDVIEIDRDLAARLRQRFPGRLRVHEQDVLGFDFAALAGADPERSDCAQEQGKGRLRVVGNLPYNISSPLLLHLTRFTREVVDQHFMLQREVVERIAAQPGGDMSRLTVMLQAWYEIEILFQVAPEAFDPPPKVDSSVVRMIPRATPLTPHVTTLQTLLAVGFSQRRKMIRNTLGKWFDLHHPALDLVAAAEFTPLLQPFTESTRRAEEITVASWCALADLLAEDLRTSESAE